MFDDPDLTPQKQSKKPRDLTNFSVADLDAYIQALRDEITRADAERTKKQAYLGTVDNFFKSKGE